MIKSIMVLLLSTFLFYSCSSPENSREEKKIGAAETVTHMADTVIKNDGYQFWAMLPKSWRNDINGIAHQIGNEIPAPMWDKTISLLGRIGDVLVTRKAVISGMLPKTELEMKEEHIHETIVQIGGFLKSISASELSTAEKLKKVNLDDIAAENLSHLLKIYSESKLFISFINQDSDIKFDSFNHAMSRFKAKEVSSEEGETVVEITDPEGASFKEKFVKVEDKWLPKGMAKYFPRELADAKEEIGKLLKQAQKEEAQVTLFIAIAEGIVKTLEDAKTDEEFKKALMSLPGNPIKRLMEGRL